MSRPDFFKTGVMAADLNLAGKHPCSNDKFANLAISSEKTLAQLLRIDAGTKSSLDDLGTVVVSNLGTSSGVTGGRELKY